jgi:hypothetical protein
LTTWDLIDAARQVAPVRRHEVSTKPRTRGTPAASRTRVAPGELPRRPPRGRRPSWPAHLTPLGDTAANLAAHVAGHRRQLSPGWTPSTEARERARQLGIRLAPDETWVRPHVRGAPAGSELRFEWKP